MKIKRGIIGYSDKSEYTNVYTSVWGTLPDYLTHPVVGYMLLWLEGVG